MTKYSLSFVVATRNDDHGGNMSNKIKLFINTWTKLVKKYNSNFELIIVDWNSPKKKGSIRNNFKFKKIKSKSSIKIVEIRESEHKKLLNSKKLNFYQMIAKNIGAKCASSKRLLITNIDIIFSEKIFQKLNTLSQKYNEIYRATRYDVNIKNFKNINENYLDKKVTRINYPNYTFEVKKNKYYKIKSNLIDYIKKIFTTNYFKIFFELNFFSIIKTFIDFFKNNLFTNACGDFILINKKFFFKIGGFYEFQGYSWNIDNFFMWQAFYKKAKFKNFQEKIYHLDHKSGSGYTAGSKSLFLKLDKKKINYINNYELFKLIHYFRKDKNFLKKKQRTPKINFSIHNVS
tara:strand:- start:1655 stop:2692 length:1038 start_codon:yes stop_codon:yes gene_type:complete